MKTDDTFCRTGALLFLVNRFNIRHKINTYPESSALTERDLIGPSWHECFPKIDVKKDGRCSSSFV